MGGSAVEFSPAAQEAWVHFLANAATASPWVSWVAQMVKNLTATQETQVQSLGQKEPLDEGIATHSGILTWKTPWTEEPGGLQSVG